MRPALIVAVAVVLVAGCSKPAKMDERVHLDQVQVVGTHNSYHRHMPDRLFGLLSRFSKSTAESLDYDHPPIARQLDEGIRQLEIDVFADDRGGRFASRATNPLIGKAKASGIAALDQPGFKVLHAPDVDYESSCLTFHDCLLAIEQWSDAHQAHLPIMVLVEGKEDATPDPLHLGFAQPLPLTATRFDALDAAIRAVFPPARVITPDDVRGKHATLRDAVTTDGWPDLEHARGKVLFCLDNGSPVRDRYVAGHPSLRGRVMFVTAPVGSPEAAFVSRPDPVRQSAEIRSLVRQGFLVRTRADADTVEARTGQTARRYAALASGATYVSTDYPDPDPRWPAYRVRLPGDRLFRCNPVNATDACDSTRLE